MGYEEWRNFLKVIDKAKIACEASGHAVTDHFVDVNKMVELGSNSQRKVDDIMLARYACYLIAQNGNPQKQEIAFAQTYFAVQTRRAELIEQRLLESERVLARKKLSETEKTLSRVIFEQMGSHESFGLIRSKGDLALFNKPTQAISDEHITNNTVVRKTLLERGIEPEKLPPAEDIKKLERRLVSEQTKSLKETERLN